MGADLSYANADAVKEIGVLSKYDTSSHNPPGWTEAVIHKIQQDIISHSNTGGKAGQEGGGYDYTKDFTPEENAAYKWYTDEVIEPEHWKRLVSEYKGTTAAEGVHPQPFNPDDKYIPEKGSGFTAPGVNEYNGPDNKDGALVVSTDAINYFINELKTIAGDGTGVLLDARKAMDKINLKPGGFARAELLRQKVMGTGNDDPGLRGDAMDLMTTIHSALFNMQTDLHNMMTEYASAEDFNKLTADQFGEVMDDAWGKIGDLDQYGKGSSSGTTGGGDGT